MSGDATPRNAVVLYTGPAKKPAAPGQIQVLASEPVQPRWIADPMTAAITWLNEIGILYYRASAHQLKLLGDVSFYPRKGTIVVDGNRKMPRRGLPGLRDYLGYRLRCKLPPVPRTRWGS